MLLDFLSLAVSDEVVVQHDVRPQAQRFSSDRLEDKSRVAVGEVITKELRVFKMHRLSRRHMWSKLKALLDWAVLLVQLECSNRLLVQPLMEFPQIDTDYEEEEVNLRDSIKRLAFASGLFCSCANMISHFLTVSLLILQLPSVGCINTAESLRPLHRLFTRVSLFNGWGFKVKNQFFSFFFFNQWGIWSNGSFLRIPTVFRNLPESLGSGTASHKCLWSLNIWRRVSSAHWLVEMNLKPTAFRIYKCSAKLFHLMDLRGN